MGFDSPLLVAVITGILLSLLALLKTAISYLGKDRKERSMKKDFSFKKYVLVLLETLTDYAQDGLVQGAAMFSDEISMKRPASVGRFLCLGASKTVSWPVLTHNSYDAVF